MTFLYIFSDAYGKLFSVHTVINSKLDLHMYRLRIVLASLLNRVC